MGQGQSRGEELYMEAVKGDVEAVKALHRTGADLEWTDKEGKTPLIVACMSSHLSIVAETLIELGANINACSSGRYDSGTPLHHAAKRGLLGTVVLLLSRGANPMLRNSNCVTPLEIAKIQGFSDVVDAIEIKMLHLPKENTTSVSSNANGWGNATDNSSLNGWGASDGSTRTELHKSGWIHEPAVEEYNGWGESRPSGNELLPENKLSSVSDDGNGWGDVTDYSNWGESSGLTAPELSRSKCIDDQYNGWDMPGSKPYSNTAQHIQAADNVLPTISQTSSEPLFPLVSSVPSAPPVPEDYIDEDPIHHPYVHFSPAKGSLLFVKCGADPQANDVKHDGSSSCVICWEAPVEGACIPCGHMAGCMACLNEIKSKQGTCPMCRTKIDQAIKIFAV